MPENIICPECNGSTIRNGSGDGEAILCTVCEWSTWARNIEEPKAQPLMEVLESFMEAREELRGEAAAVLRLMEDDVLPEGKVHWTGEFKYVNDEDGQEVDHDGMDVTPWFQYRDESGIQLWAALVADSYMMMEGEW